MVKTRAKPAACLRILCALALLCLGLAHQAPVIRDTAQQLAAFEAYRLPDGSFPIWCVTDQDGQDKSGSHDPRGLLHDHGCEACQINAAADLPPPSDFSMPFAYAPGKVIFIERHEAHYRTLFPPNHAPRAPPVYGLTV